MLAEPEDAMYDLILNFDPFGKDHMIYTIRNKCEEVPELEYDDGLRFYYFYTGGTKGGNQQLRTMLTYMQDSREENAVDEATREVHDYVNRVKVRPEVKDAYMTLEEYIFYERKDEAIDTRVEAILELLEEYGEIPEKVRERLGETRDIATLKKWHKLAAKVHSIAEFEAKADLWHE